jgi:hypothetical protein
MARSSLAATEQRGVDRAEHGYSGADADAHRDDDRQRDYRDAHQAPDAYRDVLREVLEHQNLSPATVEE